MSLLAVDLGLRTGLALFGADGRLIWYRSQNFGSAPRLRRGVHGLLHTLPELRWLVMEGGGPLADIWEKEADRRGLQVRRIGADVWRRELLWDREQRSGAAAKANADPLARRVIDWSGAARPTSLRHDAAEAILVGLWGVLHTGILPALPPELRR
ncbi:hypothetical protein [Longimicrobium terrae]|uniref:Uncharacterized protein n=1 Tax=Longimicrobium terrae TaxID=1639882 RepID=A0A841GT64_9BACT|nr:hypothetical protein [Longimicrobium terrae]MBB4635296.1 hypothetical protein [Longimicrobium terrae]MBB6069689.1 hypothetical protein [Longimicrobium terrae]NNC31100.1 hypothetical protein [Longimicrobium terrae]